MTPIDNKHVERILSLIVILYGLWLLFSNVEIMFSLALRGLGLFDLIFYEGSYALSRIIVSCCVLVFFPYVVYWIGYFATREKVRSQRRWTFCEIVAVPLVLFGLNLFLQTCCSLIMAISGVSHGYAFFGWREIITVFFALSFFVTVVAVLLCCVRRIAAWLLRKAD